MVICAELHPTISNIFLDQIDYHSTKRSELVNYNQFLYVKYYKLPFHRSICDKLSAIYVKICSLQEQIENCSVTFNGDNSVVEPCFEKFNATLQEIIIDLSDVLVNCTKRTYLHWNLFLLTLIHNKLHVKMFDQNEQKSFSDDRALKRLVSFAYAMKLMFEERYHISCAFGPFAGLVDKHEGSSEGTTDNNNMACKKWKIEINSVEDLKNVAELSWIFAHEKEFGNFKNATRKLLDRFSAIRLQLDWAGKKTTLQEVHDNYENRVFDVRDSEDYAYFVLRWITTVTYSRLMDIPATQIDTKDLWLYDFEKNGLGVLIYKMFTLYMNRMQPIRNLFTVALAIIVRNSGNTEYIVHHANQIRDGFKLLGFEQHPLPYMDGMVAKRIYTFFLEVKLLLDIYNIP